MPFEIFSADDPRAALQLDALTTAEQQVRLADLCDEDTRDARQRVLEFCEAHRGDDEEDRPNALYRECLDGHLTGSAFVVDSDAERTLLLHHAKLDRWLQPGGHADGNGNLAAVALREAAEETGIEGLRVVAPAIDIDVHRIPARPGEPEHLHLDVRFLVLAPSGAEVRHNAESLAARWVMADDPAVSGSDELTRGVARALAVAATLV